MNEHQLDRIEAAVRSILINIGEDPDREGLKGTPNRVARAWKEFVDWDADNPNNMTMFESIVADQMIVVTGIRVWSMCEHHLLPFSCNISVGYIPAGKDGKVLGLSKIPRIVQSHAHRLQLQERLVNGIAEEMDEKLDPLGVAVVASGIHTCMVMRGIRTDGVMTSSSMHGAFRRQPEVRQEFFSLIQHARDTGGL